MGPLPVGSTPTQGKEAVGHLTETGRSAIAQGGKIGDEAQVPKNQGYREVGRYRKNVPEKRTTKILPNGVGIWDGGQKPSHPDPTHVEGGKDPGADHGKNCHRFGRSVDRSPPFLTC